MTQSDLITLTPEQLRNLIAVALEPVYQAIAVLQRQQIDLANIQQGQQVGWDVGKRMLEEQAKAKSQTDDNGNGHKPLMIPAAKGRY